MKKALKITAQATSRVPRPSSERHPPPPRTDALCEDDPWRMTPAPKHDENPDHDQSAAGLPTKKDSRTQGKATASVHTAASTDGPEITMVEVPALKPKRRVFEVTPTGGLDALFPRGRFDDSHATWCVHRVGDANNAIKHVSRESGARIGGRHRGLPKRGRPEPESRGAGDRSAHHHGPHEPPRGSGDPRRTRRRGGRPRVPRRVRWDPRWPLTHARPLSNRTSPGGMAEKITPQIHHNDRGSVAK